jgi:hypothetical protein
VPDRLSRLVDLPFPANRFFAGRDDDLLSIHEMLHPGPVPTLTQGRVCAVAAMGGMGKTTLANEYARRYWRLYPQILWIDARRGYESEFARLFDRLFPDRSAFDANPNEKALQALRALDGPHERLLVIDNVEDAESVRAWLPRAATGACRTLITSRYTDWPEAAGIRAVSLGVLQPEPARDFLLSRTGRAAEEPERIACDDLAKALGYLPLSRRRLTWPLPVPVRRSLTICGFSSKQPPIFWRAVHWDRPTTPTRSSRHGQLPWRGSRPRRVPYCACVLGMPTHRFLVPW